jgi:PKD domain-containing protein
MNIRRETRTQAGRFVGMLLAALCLLPMRAEAAAWDPPVDLSPPRVFAEAPQVAVDDSGDAIAVWIATRGGTDVVQASVRPAASGAWQPAVDISPAGRVNGPPHLAVDSVGDAVALWQQLSSGEYVARASVRVASSGVWQMPVDLSKPAGSYGGLDVAVNAAGDAVAVWSRQSEAGNGTDLIVQASVRPAATGTWGPPADLSLPGGMSAEPRVAIDAAGNILAVWSRRGTAGNALVQSAVRHGLANGWASAINVSKDGQDAGTPRVALDASGNAVATWTRFNGSNWIVQASRRPASLDAWTAAVDLSQPGHDADQTRLAVDARGDVVVGWKRSDGTNTIAQAAVGSTGPGPWGPPIDVSAPGANADTPVVAIGTGGDAFAVWQRSLGAKWVVQASVRAASSGVWQPPLDLTAPADEFEPQVAVDPGVNAVAVWSRLDGSSGTVQATRLAAAGPSLDALAVPTAGVAGQTIPFAVVPMDVWAPLPPARWSFGDGATAAGSSVTHAFARAGRYVVSVTVANALGKQTTESRTVDIVVAPTGSAAIQAAAIQIAAAHQARRLWRLPGAPAHRRLRRVPVGTTFSLDLNVPGHADLSFAKLVPGRRAGGGCVASARAGRGRAACTRQVPQGRLTFAAPAGTTLRPFAGRLGPDGRLTPGRYVVTITATDAAGRTSNAVELRFRIAG